MAQMKITVDLDTDLYRAAKVEAARSDLSVREVFEEAISGWLDARADAEDRASADAALAEYRRDGGVPASEFYGHLAAETREIYGPKTSEQAESGPAGSGPAGSGPAGSGPAPADHTVADPEA